VLGHLEDAVASLTFRERPRHLAVGANESAIGPFDPLGCIADRTHDRDEVNILARSGRAARWSAPRVRVVTSREGQVVPSSLDRVAERFPGSIDAQCFPGRLGQDVIGRAEVFVRM
jgi:hypothetical protein